MTTPELLVLIVPDGGLRGALIGRLSLLGESLVTLTEDPDETMLGRVTRVPSILIIDAETLRDRHEALHDSGAWHGIIVLADDSADPGEAAANARADRVHVLDRRRAIAEIPETLARWRMAHDGAVRALDSGLDGAVHRHAGGSAGGRLSDEPAPLARGDHTSGPGDRAS